MSVALNIMVRGVPAPQGSKRAIVNRYTGRAAVVESSKKVAPWRDAVRSDCATAWTGHPMLDEPIVITLAFFFPRPASHYGTGRNATRLKPSAPQFPSSTPDLDKLVRSTMDGITAAGVWRDDARVVQLSAIKYYAARDEPAGARITIGTI